MADPDFIQEQFLGRRLAMRPTLRTWLKHLLLLTLTLFTATIAGVLYPFGVIDTFPTADPQTWREIGQFILSIPTRYAAFIASVVYGLATDAGLLAYGLSFSVSLLFILISHEMGHYVACRIYGVDATLPFFVPTPPLIGPAGTFGAFIKIMSPMPSRRAVFDIGVAGPIAGFIALIPVAVLGLISADPNNTYSATDIIVFANPLFMKGLAYVLGTEIVPGFGNPFYFAAWVGLLVTALNLIPSGQLDGGHAIYSALGRRVHYWTGRAAFIAMATLSVLGWIYYSSPSGFLIAVLLGVMMRIKHPEPFDMTPLDGKRKVIALATLLIFILCFLPFPLQIN